MTDLHVKYRPTTIEEVIGQDPVVDSLLDLSESKEEGMPHAYLFSGPSGVGKTTLARVIASEFLDCPLDRILEVDAATYSGVDKTRELVSRALYGTIGADCTVIIIDEAHALSKQAWQVLLKPLEESSEKTYFFLCTTEHDKVPKTIRTRCHHYDLKPVEHEAIEELLEKVADDEGLDVADEVVKACALEAKGSVRQGLVYLSMCRGCETKEDAYLLMQEESATPELIDLCRLLASPVSGITDGMEAFNKARKILAAMESVNAESARIVISVYMARVLLHAKAKAQVMWAINVCSVFAGHSYNPSEKLSPLLVDLAIAFGLDAGD